MRLSIAFAVLVTVVVAVSARVYPAKTGAKGGSGHSKGGSDVNGTGRPDGDRFHLQSDDGQYVFGHTAGNQGRAEMRAKDGTVTGYYSYADGNGQVVYVNYVADKNGYRVLSNTGVPSASVTIEGDVEKKGSGSEKDFQKVFADFTNRIKDKVVQQAGQKVVDIISEGQSQVTVNPVVYPIEEKKHEEPFQDWNQIKTMTTKKPTMDGRIDHDEGQQPQENVDPNWDNIIKITTQQSNIKGHDNDGQKSTEDDWISSITTTETASKIIPIVPHQPQVPTKGGYSDIVLPKDNDKEISTEVADSRIAGTKSTVIDDAENSSPVTKPVSVINDVQTTMSYNDRTAQVTEVSEDIQMTNSGVKRFEESSTVVISESATEHYHVIKKNDENNIKFPIEADVLTTIKPLDEESFENVPTTGMPPGGRDNFQTTDVVPGAVDDGKIQENVVQSISTSPAAPVYEPSLITTSQPDDTEITTVTAAAGIKSEESKDRVEIRTLEPNERIGTTINPDFGQADVQEQEINWPEIPQEPIPQVLVPLDPYPDNRGIKNAGIKTESTNSRLVRQNSLFDVSTTTESIHNVNNKSATSFNFPTYYFIG